MCWKYTPWNKTWLFHRHGFPLWSLSSTDIHLWFFAASCSQCPHQHQYISISLWMGLLFKHQYPSIHLCPIQQPFMPQVRSHTVLLIQWRCIYVQSSMQHSVSGWGLVCLAPPWMSFIHQRHGHKCHSKLHLMSNHTFWQVNVFKNVRQLPKAS